MKNDNHSLSVEDATELALDRLVWRLLAASGATHWIGTSRTMMMMMMMMIINRSWSKPSAYRCSPRLRMSRLCSPIVTRGQTLLVTDWKSLLNERCGRLIAATSFFFKATGACLRTIGHSVNLSVANKNGFFLIKWDCFENLHILNLFHTCGWIAE